MADTPIWTSNNNFSVNDLHVCHCALVNKIAYYFEIAYVNFYIFPLG